jgi:site-specific recombinase XerD
MNSPNFGSNKEVIDRYVKDLKLKKKKELYFSGKLWNIYPFFKWIDKNSEDINRDDIEAYSIAVIEGSLKKTTKNKYLLELKLFFEFVKPGNDYFSGIEFWKLESNTSEKHFITRGDVVEMLKYCKNQRDRALVFLMWESDARLEELLSLTVVIFVLNVLVDIFV